MGLQEERIHDLSTGLYLLTFEKSEGGCIWDEEKKEKMILPQILAYQSSVLKMIGEDIGTKLSILKRFLINSSSFEFLSPDEMRMRSRGWADTIRDIGKDTSLLYKRNAIGEEAGFYE